MSKKVIGALLAIVMVLSVFSFTVFAAGATKYETASNGYTQIWGLKTNGDKIDVILTTDYEVGPISFQIEGVASIDSIELGDGYYAGSTIDRAEDGTILIFPITGGATPLKGVKMNESVIASFTYTKDSQNSTPSIRNNPKGNTVATVGGKLIATRLSGDYVDYSDYYVGQENVTIYGLDAEWEDVPVTPPAGGDVKLQVKSGVTGVVVNENYTFGGTCDGVVFGLTVTGDGSETKKVELLTNVLEASDGSELEIKAYKGKQYGSGTTIKVGDKTYVVVIFGDATGDGKLNGQDVTAINKANMEVSTPEAALSMACQTKYGKKENVLGAINGQDYTEMNKHVQGVAEIDQAKLAAAFTDLTVTMYK